MRCFKIVLALLQTSLGCLALGAPSAAQDAAQPSTGPLASLIEQVAELEAENRALERELARYQAGLERAVAELNRERERRRGRSYIEPARRPTPPPPAPPAALPLPAPPPPPPAPRPLPPPEEVPGLDALLDGDRLLSPARVRVEAGEAVVTGEIRNPVPRELRGVLTIRLLRDGRPVDVVRRRFVAPPARPAPYRHSFTLHGWAAGRYEASVRFDH